MAKIEFLAGYSNRTGSGFIANQLRYSSLFVFGADLDFRGSSKQYTITTPLNGASGPITSLNVIKGKLKANLPFNKRQVKSVESLQFDDITGELVSGVRYSGLKKLTLDQFIDDGLDSLKKVLNGNDQIFGNVNRETILSGFRGNDELFIESRNIAVGGAGKDTFYLSKNTRFAQIVDYKPNKGDSIVILDDFAENYFFDSKFGQITVQNQSGDILAFVNDFGLDEARQSAIISGENVLTFGDNSATDAIGSNPFLPDESVGVFFVDDGPSGSGFTSPI